MTIHTDLMRGLLLFYQSEEPIAIDTVLIGQGVVQAFPETWWMLPEQARADSSLILRGQFKPTLSGWVMDNRPDGRIWLQPAEDTGEQERIDRVVQSRRLHKDLYLNVWGSVNTYNPVLETSRSQWLALAREIPVLTAAEILYVPERRIGRILLAKNGVVTSVLLLDVHRNDYLVDGESDSWLESIGSEWAQTSTSLDDFITWVRTKTPYGPSEIARVDSVNASGPLSTIAPSQHRTTV